MNCCKHILREIYRIRSFQLSLLEVVHDLLVIAELFLHLLEDFEICQNLVDFLLKIVFNFFAVEILNAGCALHDFEFGGVFLKQPQPGIAVTIINRVDHRIALIIFGEHDFVDEVGELGVGLELVGVEKLYKGFVAPGEQAFGLGGDVAEGVKLHLRD